tara:strand:- start:98 stop:364 length:267 start_codon:yes stop_codon:yes gene_type:complete
VAAVAHGQKTIEVRSKEPNSMSEDDAVSASADLSRAVTEKIRTGIISGRINSEINTPERLEPSTRAAPIAPIKLIVGVPRSMLKINVV